VLLAVALTVVGCGGAPTAGDSPGPVPTQATTQAPVTPADPDAEEPGSQGGGGGGSVRLVSLPGGDGVATVTDGRGCVLWTPQDLPEGVAVRVTTVEVRPAGVARLPGGCGDVPACEGSTVSAAEPATCSVAFGPPPGTTAVVVDLRGEPVCSDAAACAGLADRWAANAGTELTLDWLDGPGGTPDDPPDDPPDDAPSTGGPPETPDASGGA
jgi:hypothetical protein